MPDGSPMTDVFPDKPTHPGEWSWAQIQEKLSRPVPPSLLKQKKQGGATITFVPWPTIADVLDKYCPGWCWTTEINFSSERIFVTGQLSIPTADGIIIRSAIGTETLKREKTTQQGIEMVEHAYGDPSSNAESMAFRRAAAKLGFGRELWKKKE